ncbi:cyclic GMP-AMP synthase-like receptor [Condylostylus longicornis]|uniref:cyclic GMP-AMP synthase-like receptor n=1 Tax=Condylostylus longicornis TaxID=2530218 RepID=UPI00244E270E|nr:cyclic GMP-AMP synthase-like receptor [Condylostylus longicornis]
MSSIESDVINRLMKINRFITLPKTEKASKTDDFNNITKFFIDKLKNYDPAFNKLYKGHRLAGSYADKLKIGEADEFDLIIKLKIDSAYDIEVTEDPDFPGYCNINLKDMMLKLKEKCEKEEAKIWYYKHFESLIDENSYLIQDKVHEWIERLMANILYEDLKDGELKINENTIYSIKYSTSGPAHTINLIRTDRKLISIDLVPAFIFDETKWVVERNLPSTLANIIPKEDLYWIALPKPIKGKPKPNKSFLTSFVDIERHLISDRNNLKNTLKMLKKLRDRKKLDYLKSYFIKTVYLWENDIQDRKFWDQSSFEVLKHMILKIIEHLKNKNLPYFWHKEQNMFGNLSEDDIKHMLSELNEAYDILINQPNEIFNLFLTYAEQLKLEEDLANFNCNAIQLNSNPIVIENTNNEPLASSSEENRSHSHIPLCSFDTPNGFLLLNPFTIFTKPYALLPRRF